MENRYKVVMLPTNEASSVFTDFDSEVPQMAGISLRDFYQNQHLYVVDTQSSIEVGDWVILDNSFLDKAIKVESGYVNNFNHFSKIVAATDSELGLLTIPRYFIEAYCKNSNVEILGAVITMGVFLPTLHDSDYPEN